MDKKIIKAINDNDKKELFKNFEELSCNLKAAEFFILEKFNLSKEEILLLEDNFFIEKIESKYYLNFFSYEINKINKFLVDDDGIEVDFEFQATKIIYEKEKKIIILKKSKTIDLLNFNLNEIKKINYNDISYLKELEEIKK